jgi:hypothetical protein
MGAATAMFYSNEDERISAVCYDSSYSDFILLAKELCTKHVSLPEFLIETCLFILRNTILSKNTLDINKLRPIKYASGVKCPGFFVHALNDELVKMEHSLSLFQKYGGINLNI